MPISRPYDPDRDRDHAIRVWKEVGWIEKDAHERAFDVHVSDGGARVVEQDGAAEALVITSPGVVRFDTADLPASFVTAVTVSRVSRRKGYATRATAEAIAEDARAGAALSALGIFDQGFYDKLGYGTGGGQLIQSIDPADLMVDVPTRTPVRLGLEDYADIHACRLARRRGHGGASLTLQSVTQSELHWTDAPFGLGFRDDSGRLTHHLWMNTSGEYGPWKVDWYAYRSLDELLELLGLLRGLSDQVRSVRIQEPAHFQLQDVLRRPFRSAAMRKGGTHASHDRWAAWWQMRICDVERCVGAMKLPGEPVDFDLVLSDPLDDLVGGVGASGRWTVRLGPESSAERGHRGGLPVLDASIGAFTRLWLGVLPASTLAATDRLSADASLLARLDRLIRLPRACPDWPF